MKRHRGLATVVGAIVMVGAITACDPRSLVVTTTTEVPPPPPPAATAPPQRNAATPSRSTQSIRHSGTSQTRTTLQSPAHSSTASQKKTQAPGCLPVYLWVRSVGITGSVKPMGLTTQGTLEPPPKQIIWYNRSVLPGQDGIAVIAGHVTYGSPDKFYTLRNVNIGARVSIRCHDGSTLALKVTKAQGVSKAALTKDSRVWGTSPSPIVALITCDKDTTVVNGHHLGNWVVWAVPTKH